MSESVNKKSVEGLQHIINQFKFEVTDGHIDLRSYPSDEVIKFFRFLVESGTVLFHGTNTEERFYNLEVRQAKDAAKESGNKKAIYADAGITVPLALAVLNKAYLRSRLGGFTTGWENDKNGKMIFKFDPQTYQLLKSGDTNLFSDGFVYVLNKANFVNAEDAGAEWHSEVNQKPLLACRVSKTLAVDIFIIGMGERDTVVEYSAEELSRNK